MRTATRKKTKSYSKTAHRSSLLIVLFIASACIGIYTLIKPFTEPDNLTHQPYASPTYAEKTPINIQLKKEVALQVYTGQTIEQMDLEDYVLHVVAGEMPASYEAEALQAQAVAARTYTLRKMLKGGCANHTGADICTDSAHCQAFCTDAKMQEKWGDAYAENLEKIKTAVVNTSGEVLSYNGEPINALFHAASGGRTEDVQNVFSSSLPYLVGVESPGEADNSTVTFTASDFVKKANAAYADATLTANAITKNVKVLATHPSGQVAELQLGNTTITGREARTTFSLRSANFTITVDASSVVFHVNGYGHGVGLSQKGANAMAKNGSDYKTILTHYYTGVSFDEASNYK